MRLVTATLIACALCLSGCADGGGPDGGVANYDALKSAHDKCSAQGGKLVLKDQGNARDIQAYACKRT
jgi:hypothetical protein